MEGPSRIESAREQVRRSRYVIGALAGLAFLGVGAVARAAHPGVQHTTAPTAAAPAESSTFSADADGSGSFFGDGDGATVTPSQGAAPPIVQSGGS